MGVEIALLSSAQIEKIHTASIEMLERFGVIIPHKEVLKLFYDAGAEIDHDTQLVKIPEKLVNHCLEICKKQFTVYGRDLSKKAEFGMGKRNYNTSAGQAWWVDDNFVRRYATLRDLGTAVRLGDTLPQINIVGAMVDPHEIPIEYRCVSVVAEQLKYTTKPISFFYFNRSSTKFILELFTIVAGSKEKAIQYPLACSSLEPISPLRFPQNEVDLLFETCSFHLPVPIGPMSQTGATAPGTLAGTMAQENAEILAGNCIVQLINPGNPICYGGIPHAFDMKTMQTIFAGPEQVLMAIGMTQMGNYYNLPVWINVGLTDSKLPDAQGGLEAGITLAFGVVTGADIYGHLGICGVDQGTSLLILMMQHELINYVERLMQEVEISDEKLGLPVIQKARHEGSFITEEHTVKHFRQELWFPELLDRNVWETWIMEGKKDMMDRCKEMKDRLLNDYNPVPLDINTQKEINKVLKAAKKHLLKD